MKVATAGTFIFCCGQIIIDGWAFEQTEPGEQLTNEAINKCVLDYLYAGMVDVPTADAQRAAAALVDKLRKGPG